MTNDQLTELSAQAIGLRLLDAPTDNGARIIHPDDGGGFWNPLQSGDDVVRLIAVLRINVDYLVRMVSAMDDDAYSADLKWKPHQGHAASAAALRRAVTELAAQIGQMKKEQAND